MKLVTWNTQWCCGFDGRVDPQRIVDDARAMADFDVLCLQEIAANFPAPEGQPRQTSSPSLRRCCRASGLLRRGGGRRRAATARGAASAT